MAHPYWPLFDVEVRTPRLTMRYIDDEMATELATLAAHGIHDPDRMPFAMPWSTLPSPELERQALQFYWRCRVETTVDTWTINFAVIVDDVVVGTSELDVGRQLLEAPPVRDRVVVGQGVPGPGASAPRLRIATLQLGFVGFDAEWAVTGAWHDNDPSLGVTRSLGYDRAGSRRMVRNDDHGDELIGFEHAATALPGLPATRRHRAHRRRAGARSARHHTVRWPTSSRSGSRWWRSSGSAASRRTALSSTLFAGRGAGRGGSRSAVTIGWTIAGS